MKKYGILLLAVCLLSGCTSAANITEKAGQAISDEIQHQASKTDPNVQSVKGGTLGEYTDITVGEAFETFFAEPKWKYFEADTGEDVVEFTGYCTYQEVQVLARVQFIVDEETFEVGALSFNDVPQNELVKFALLSKIYEEEVVEEIEVVEQIENAQEQLSTSDQLVSDEVMTMEIDNQFTENVIGFDLKEFVNMKFDMDIEIQDFLSQYGFQIVSGDAGAFHAVDELETSLFITTMGDYESGWSIESVVADVPNYTITLNEVKRICDPDNEKEIQYDEENAVYYYAAEIDGVKVHYNFSFDALREANPQVLSLTIIA